MRVQAARFGGRDEVFLRAAVSANNPVAAMQPVAGSGIKFTIQ